MIAAVVALALLTVAASPASAASEDGTSNTIKFTVTSALLDQAHHRVLVTAPGTGGLAAGKRLATAEVVTPRFTIILSDVLVASVVGTSSSLSLNFANVNIDYAQGGAPCMPGVDACLMEVALSAIPGRWPSWPPRSPASKPRR